MNRREALRQAAALLVTTSQPYRADLLGKVVRGEATESETEESDDLKVACGILARWLEDHDH